MTSPGIFGAGVTLNTSSAALHIQSPVVFRSSVLPSDPAGGVYTALTNNAGQLVEFSAANGNLMRTLNLTGYGSMNLELSSPYVFRMAILEVSAFRQQAVASKIIPGR